MIATPIIEHEHYEKHIEYIIFGIYIVSDLLFQIFRWVWLSKALSESVKVSGGKLISLKNSNKTDADTTIYMPSSKRYGGYLIVKVICFNEVYVTIMTQEFKDSHLQMMLLAVAVCWGFVTGAQLISAWRGNSQPNNNTQTPPIQGK